MLFAWELYVALDGNIKVLCSVNIYCVVQNVCELMRTELPHALFAFFAGLNIILYEVDIL